MIPTCTGEFKQRMVAFLDRFKTGPLGSVSIGSSLDSLDNTADGEPSSQQQEPIAAAVGKL